MWDTRSAPVVENVHSQRSAYRATRAYAGKLSQTVASRTRSPMDHSLTPREIQTRVRAGASIEDLVAESGMPAERIDAFAGPVLAEREHVAQTAQVSTVRRRGESGTHRRLGELIATRLRTRSIDADDVTWDAWRQSDLKWRIIARLTSNVEAESRLAEFVFDPKGRFSVAHNSDARWMIGEEARGDAPPEEENTIDFHDELALVRATQPVSHPGDEVPSSELMHDSNEDTSELDSLYDMLSGISEDSVRIYTGILDPVQPEEAPVLAPEAQDVEEPVVDEPAGDLTAPENPAEEAPQDEVTTVIEEEPVTEVDEPTQDALVEAEDEQQKPSRRRRRAKVPSWDEIMFGGPTK
ncbi:septation protein SepH [Tessaracoccus sp. MC1865]|uniref:septation protein SepH n=1 Tax=Tessaracoccus sp. MC1865 TaxID=2760310 RepID=UPI0021071652|nr:septation protein SepH [Tessaracoccus sp. MC1865]